MKCQKCGAELEDTAQFQAPSSIAEQPLLQELHEAENESKAADFHEKEKPEETAGKEIVSTLQREPVQTEPDPESAPTAMPETSVKSAPTQPTEVPAQPTEPAKPTEPEPETTTPPQPTEPAGCTHDWQCVHHDEEGHWLAGFICDCGWVIYGSPDEVSAAWNAHSASFPPEEALFEHGGYGCVDEWVVDTPAYEEWYCSLCGEQKP